MIADGTSTIATPSKDLTVRQFVRLTLGGSRLRIRISNAFGTAPLALDHIRVAIADPNRAGAVLAGGRAVTFASSPEVIIPAGAVYRSDAIDLPTRALTTISISFHLSSLPARQTIHYVSNSVSYVARGDAGDALAMQKAVSYPHWFLLAGVDVQRAKKGRAVAVLGDSITDGHGAGTDRNQRWTDVLAERLQADPARRDVAVLNLGISGNRLVKDGATPSGLARFARDVLDQSGMHTIVVLEGTNDVGILSREEPVTSASRAAMVRSVINGYRQIVLWARERRLRVIGATLLPAGGTSYYRSDATAAEDRNTINDWIRGPDHFDGVIDFDAIMRDPQHPDRLRREYDSGDHLHPSPAGYRAMGEAVPLELIAP